MSLLFFWKKIFASLFLFIIASILLISCKKADKIDFSNNSVAEAKNWFSTNVLAGENRLLAKPFSELPKTAPERVTARMNRLSKKLDWSQAKFSTAEGLEYVIVPLLKDDLPLKDNYFMKRVFVFYKYNEKPMEMQVVELLTKRQPAANPVQLAAAFFEKKETAKQLTVQSPDLQVFFYNSQYQSMDEYEVKNNQWLPLNASAFNKPANEQLRIESENGSCAEWGMYLVTYDNEGNEVERELLYTFWVGDCGGDNPEEEQPEPGGGGDNTVYESEATREYSWTVASSGGFFYSSWSINGLVKLKAKRNDSHPNGGYFTDAKSLGVSCSGCGSNGVTWDYTLSEASYSPDLASHRVKANYNKSTEEPTYVDKTKTYTFQQAF